MGTSVVFSVRSAASKSATPAPERIGPPRRVCSKFAHDRQEEHDRHCRGRGIDQRRRHACEEHREHRPGRRGQAAVPAREQHHADGRVDQARVGKVDVLERKDGKDQQLKERLPTEPGHREMIVERVDPQGTGVQHEPGVQGIRAIVDHEDRILNAVPRVEAQPVDVPHQEDGQREVVPPAQTPRCTEEPARSPEDKPAGLTGQDQAHDQDGRDHAGQIQHTAHDEEQRETPGNRQTAIHKAASEHPSDQQAVATKASE